MKRTLIYILTGILLILLVFSGVMTVTSYSSIQVENDDFKWDEKPKYRTMIIVDGTDASHVTDIRAGLEAFALESKTAFEFWVFSGPDKDEKIIQQLDIALRSGVDGVIVEAVSDSRFEDLIERASSMDLPVVTLEKSLPESERLSFITLNQYEIGQKIGLKLKNELKSSGTVIIFNASGDQASAINSHLKNDFLVRVEALGTDAQVILDAEDVTKQLLFKYDDIVSMVCNSSEESIGVIQALKDANKLDDIQVVAFGDDETIMDFVSRDVILGTVVPDMKEMGYMALKNLYDFNEGNLVPSYQNTPVELITNDNMEKEIYEK
ncbi:sugar ABC transporter substrate-binding protein [Acidaminobacter sp. JC074]|uniref:sugar ABC transporter substrate-binding protein n=1 Tax=Acidaminobacter sp. JC074 TaxID=2530199 RepID=UPI001F1106BC|nr:substrate-binding domain-containing protein [Acidaminobacter sp. JC074]MCH4891151.1 sugar ABC transporter substrate-binding protein [Acidaminobacter sp. JC074]